MERSEFAKLALAQIKKARPSDISILDEEKFLVVTTDTEGSSSITSLSNYYDEYMHAAAERRQGLLDRIGRIGRMVESEEKLDEVRVMLVPRIRPRRYFEIDALQLAQEVVSKGDPAPKVAYYTPLAEHLGVAVAIDRPEHIEYIGDPASRFGVPGSELDAMALANIERMTKEGLRQVHPGLWLGVWEDEYAPERMLLTRLFTKTELDLKGDPVVFLPGAERLYVVGSEDEASLELVLELVDQRIAEPRPLLPFGFVLRDGRWQLFEPAGELGRELGARLAKHLADGYAVQREALGAARADEADPPFVAGVMGIGDDDGNLRLTVTTWTDGVHALLPRAQVIGIGRLEGDAAVSFVPWEDVMELAGEHFTQVAGVYPPRWETRTFPDERTLQRLRARALDMGGGKREAREERDEKEKRSGAPASAPASKARIVAALVIGAVVALGVVYALSH